MQTSSDLPGAAGLAERPVARGAPPSRASSDRRTDTPVLVHLARRTPSPGASTLAAFALAVVMGVVDYVTGAELSFSIFYLLPVSLATLAGGRLPGFLVAAFSAGLWFCADFLAGHVYSHPSVPFWNAAVRLGYFCLHTLFLSALRTSLEHERELARTDPLTGVANWRGLEEYFSRELGNPSAPARPVTIAYIDIDNFGTVNNLLGHEAGNDVLRAITHAAAANVRSSDIVARVGGDEICVLLPGAEPSGARAALERMRRQVAALAAEKGWPVTLSVGAVTFYPPLPTLDAMMGRADKLMYSIKRSGKDGLRYEVEEGLSAGGAGPVP